MGRGRLLGTKEPVIAVQDRRPSVAQRLDRVGVEGIRVNLSIRPDQTAIPYLVTANIYIDLDDKKKGVHMSRLVAGVNEAVVSCGAGRSLEGVARAILSRSNNCKASLPSSLHKYEYRADHQQESSSFEE